VTPRQHRVTLWQRRQQNPIHELKGIRCSPYFLLEIPWENVRKFKAVLVLHDLKQTRWEVVLIQIANHGKREILNLKNTESDVKRPVFITALQEGSFLWGLFNTFPVKLRQFYRKIVKRPYLLGCGVCKRLISAF
jgi:hypothetical protein